MAIIITPGAEDGGTAWPVGTVVTCPRCNCEFSIDAGDVERQGSVYQPSVRLMPAQFSMGCPNPECRQRLAISDSSPVASSSVGVGPLTQEASEESQYKGLTAGDDLT